MKIIYSIETIGLHHFNSLWLWQKLGYMLLELLGQIGSKVGNDATLKKKEKVPTKKREPALMAFLVEL